MWLKKVKNTFSWKYVLEDLNREKNFGAYYVKKLQKTNQTKFRVEKLIKRKGDKLYVKWKGYYNLFNTWIDKNISLHKMSYFPEPDTRSKSNMKFELDLSSYATTSDLLKIAKNIDLTSLKSDVDWLDIDKLETTPADLSKASNVVKIVLLKRLCIMNWLKMLMPLILVDLFKKRNIHWQIRSRKENTW